MQKFRNYLSIGIIAGLLLGAIMVWQAVFYFQTRAGKVLIRVLDVGQGDAIFMETAAGNQILIDGGPDVSVVRRLSEIMLPWDKTIDAIILTHPHADHISGLLEVLRRYRVGAVIESGAMHSVAEFGEWQRLIVEKNIPRHFARRGMRVTDGGVNFSILLPEDSLFNSGNNVHDNMVILQMDFGKTSALFMGDAEKKLEYKLAALGDLRKTDILKTGHHGSKTSTSDFFLSAIRPDFAVISAGRKNRYGHPAAEVLARLQTYGVKIFRTDVSGTVTFISDGAKIFPYMRR